MDEFMLSLAWNPFDPFEEYELWLSFDHGEGFDTAGLLARSVVEVEGLTGAELTLGVEQAIDSIVANPSFGGIYVKIVRKD